MCMMITDRKLQTFAPAIIVRIFHGKRPIAGSMDEFSHALRFVLPGRNGKMMMGAAMTSSSQLCQFRNFPEIHGVLGASCHNQVLPWPAASCYRHPWPTDRCSKRHLARSVPAMWCPTQTLAQYETPKDQEPNTSRPPRPEHQGHSMSLSGRSYPLASQGFSTILSRVYGATSLLQVFSNWGYKPSYTEPLGNLCDTPVAVKESRTAKKTRQQHSWGGRFWRWLSGSASQIWMFYFVGLVSGKIYRKTLYISIYWVGKSMVSGCFRLRYSLKPTHWLVPHLATRWWCLNRGPNYAGERRPVRLGSTHLWLKPKRRLWKAQLWRWRARGTAPPLIGNNDQYLVISCWILLLHLH